jgi:hypothetical protein
VPCCTNLDTPVWVLEHFDVFADVTAVVRRVFDQVHLALVTQRKTVCDLSVLSPGEDSGKIFVFAYGSVSIMAIARKLSESAIVVFNEGWHERTGGVDAGDPLQPQFLHKSVLESLVRALNASLGRRCSHTFHQC